MSKHFFFTLGAQKSLRSKSLEFSQKAIRKRTGSIESCDKKRNPTKCSNLPRRKENSKELSLLRQENRQLQREKAVLEEQNDYNQAKLAKLNSTIKNLEFQLDFKLETYKTDYKEQLKDCYAKIDIMTLNLNEQLSINERLKKELSNMDCKHENLIRDYQTLSYRLLRVQNKYKSFCQRFRRFVKKSTKAHAKPKDTTGSSLLSDEYQDFLDITDLDLENSITDDTVSMSSQMFKFSSFPKTKSKKDSMDVNKKLRQKLDVLTKKLKKLSNIESEFGTTKKESDNLKTEYNIMQEKFKQCKLNLDNLTNEINFFKKKDNEHKERLGRSRMFSLLII